MWNRRNALYNRLFDIVHPQVEFDEAEKVMIKHDAGNSLIVNVVNYDFLRNMKVLTHREKDWYDVARLDELNKKHKN